MDGKEQIPGLDPQGREPSSGRLISTRARAYKVQAESQVDTEQAIVGRVGQPSLTWIIEEGDVLRMRKMVSISREENALPFQLGSAEWVRNWETAWK